jgi:hypothetical protein
MSCEVVGFGCAKKRSEVGWVVALGDNMIWSKACRDFVVVVNRSDLSKIARPDTVTKTATDLGVGAAGEDLRVTSLALVIPTLIGSVASRAETWKTGDLAEPATNEDRLEVAGVTRSHDLSHGARVELVLELAAGGVGCILSIGLQGAVFGQSRHAHGSAPFVDNAHVVAASAAEGSTRSAGAAGR